ncbi:hypothetical protein ID866_1104 [Astraeus odoratus]|nr:hypothetical protein ID866_1104 [Astraeus odoratus]
MADSFADLWASSASTKPAQQPQRLGAPAPQKPNQSGQRPQWDAFSVLSASQPTSRTHSPRAPHQAQVQTKPAVAAPQRHNAPDAFSGLFDASMSSGSGSHADTGNMSMAQRAALARKNQQIQREKGANPPPLNLTVSSAWDGLDSLARTTTSPSPSAAKPHSEEGDFDFAFGNTKPTQLEPTFDDDDWGLSEFSTPNPPAQSKAQPKSQSLWDLDDFTSPSSAQPARSQTASPPPHITGQLVEMGFTPQLARTALISTGGTNGFDVQAALDWLLAYRQAEASVDDRPENLDRHRDRERERYVSRSRSHRATRHHEESRHPQPSQTQSDTTDIPASAERLFSQASEIGRGMFSRANALFREGREKAMKMYEERAGTATGRFTGGKDGSGDGRPRWMRENPVEGEAQEDRSTDGFRDIIDNRQEYESKPRSVGSARKYPHTTQPQVPSVREVDLFNSDSSQVVYQSPFRRGKPKLERTLSSSNSGSSSSRLPDSDPPVHPRQLTATVSSTTFATYDSQKSAGTDAYKLGQYPAAADAYSRAIRTLPEGHWLRLPLLTNRAAARSKVGELSGAVEDCGAAISLVEGLIGTIGAGNERIGRVGIVVEGSIGGDAGTEVDISTGLMKAYQRRAEAYEGLEKWTPALADWEMLLGAEWAGTTRALAARGAARCRRMIGANRSTANGSVESKQRSSTPLNLASRSPKPRPKPRSSPVAVPTGNSAAVTALRTAANLAASEDAERHAHKDAVDARLIAWRQGKETNIRALLTTLDGVLWPELGWKKVGMAEVVGKGQVKVVYMRAIARVHPDKLNASNTTVEQRMIANGVFGTLNEAWNAFQQQQQ